MKPFSPAAAPPGASAARRRLHVLLVDDGDDARVRRIAALLDDAACEVVRGGIRALEDAARGEPAWDVAVLPLSAEDGHGGMRSWQGTLPHLPIVVVTDDEGADDEGADDEGTDGEGTDEEGTDGGGEAFAAGAKDHLGLDGLTPAALVRTLRRVAAYHRLEREAIAAERRYAALIEHGYEAKLVLDAEGTVIYASAAAADVVGRPVQEVRGARILDLTDAPNLPARRAFLQRVLHEPTVEHEQLLAVRRADGPARDVRVRVRNRLADPAIAALLVDLEDVTQEMLDRKAQAETEERYRRLFDNSLDGVLLTVPDGRILEVNPAFLAMLGYTDEDVRDSPLHRDDVVDADDPRLAAALEERRRTGRFRGELNFKHKDGTVVPAELTTNVYVDADGNPWSSMIVRDVSERRRAERMFEEQRERLERAENASLVMVAHAHLAGRWSKVPARLCDLLGYDEAELLSLTIAEITHPDDLEEDERRTAALLDGTIPSFELEKRYLRKDGTPVWVHITVSLVRDAKEAPHELLVYVRDISAERDADERAHRRYTLLLESQARLAERLALADDHAGIYRELLHLARTTTSADSLLISSFDAETGLRTCVFAGEILGDRFEAYDVSTLPPMPLHDCPQTRAVLGRKAVVTDDVLRTQVVEPVDFGSDDDDQPARSSVAVPLVALGEVLGVFELQSVRPAAFTEEHVGQLMMAANLAAIATKNLDLFERQRAARRKAEGDKARLESVLQQAPSLTATTEGPEHVFTMVNERYARLFADRELLGRRVVDAMPELAAQGIIDLLDGVYETGESFVGDELPMDFVDAATEPYRRYFDLVYQPLRDEHATTTGVLAQAVDITDQVEARLRAEKLNADLQAAYDGTIEGWARALDLKDEETAGHSQRVTELTLVLSRRMGVSEEELVHVRRGALLHDIGKMGVPDRILLKPGKLDADEWETMKRHAQYAHDFLHPIEHLRPALDIPYCHHEKWDGSGYPRGLAGEEIPLAARIFAIVDVFDALTSDRPYRQAWSCQQARAHIVAGRGAHFDPAVVDAFLELDVVQCGKASRSFRGGRRLPTGATSTRS